jgi:oligopeptide transport system permease protein
MGRPARVVPVSTATDGAALVNLPAPAGMGRLAWRRLRRDRIGMASLAIVAAFLALMCASYAGLIARHWDAEVGVSYANPGFMAAAVNYEGRAAKRADPLAAVPPVDLADVDPLAPRYAEWARRAAELRTAEAPRRETLPLGGDKWGRGVLAKVVKGSEVSIFVGLSAAVLATLIGTLLGAMAGYWRGRIDDLLEWLYNVFTSIPYILLVLAFAAVFSRGLHTIILILALTGWTGIYRLMRAEYLRHSGREYVRAAQALGVSHGARMFRHILPNTSPVILVQLSQSVVEFIKAEVILSFLGLGVSVDVVSWGTILAEVPEEMVIGKWWQLATAGLSMAVLVTAFSLLTDALRDALDPQLKSL